MLLKKQLYTIIFLCMWLTAAAQNVSDTLATNYDSIVSELQTQVQELQLQRIMLQEALQRSGRNARRDSLAMVERQRRIDSLRQVSKGAPLIVGGDTLFTLYARKGGMLPEARIEAIRAKVVSLGKRLTLSIDSIYVFDGDYSSDIMAGEDVIASLTDIDGMFQGKQRHELATEYAQLIQEKVEQLNAEYGLRQKLLGLLLAVLLIVAQVVCIRLTNQLARKWKFSITRRIISMLKPWRIKDYEFLDIHRQSIIVVVSYNVLRILFIVFQLCISIPLLFFIFPETKTAVFTVLGYIWEPLKDIIMAFVGFLPNIFKIAVIYLCFRYIVRGVKYFANEIAEERLKLSGFYPDWAAPTYYILRALLYSLMFVMIWPLLPNSDSSIFQGVSVFIGIIVSLGSTSIIGNVIAGMVMTYMRPFRIGDYIKVGDTVGEVIEKTVLVTRIRTRKNEVVTIQNSSLMGSQTSNFTVAAQNYGIIVHTKVTIGYDVPWQQVKNIMERAALATPGIKHDPKPFMMTTSLDDFYVEYEINAFTDDAERLPRIYSELHQNLLKSFFDDGVEIMSPHIYARRDGIDLQMPPKN